MEMEQEESCEMGQEWVCGGMFAPHQWQKHSEGKPISKEEMGVTKGETMGGEGFPQRICRSTTGSIRNHYKLYLSVHCVPFIRIITISGLTVYSGGQYTQKKSQ